MQDELISKQAVLNTISELNAISFYEAQEDSKECYYEIRKAIEQLQPKIGHWKRISIDKYVQHAMAYYKCSVCDKDIIGTHNYCPNCGCRFVEPQESEDKE